MKKFALYIAALLGVFTLGMPSLTSCSDEISGDNYYTFTSEMLSQWLQNRPEYSQFAEVVERAGLMDQLSAYGHYTCFAPNNDAMEKYLASKGKTLASLTKEDCDTIARTHIINVMYTTYEMSDGTLPAQNMNRRPLEVNHSTDDEGNVVVIINRNSTINYYTQNDSVENGMVHPVDMVLESSNNTLADTIKNDPSVSIYSDALYATGLAQELVNFRDDEYNAEDYLEFYDYMTGASIHEAATPPDEKRYGYTAFLVPNSVLKNKYGIQNRDDLYNKACEIYDALYPEDKNGPYHDNTPENLTHKENPLHRFMAYHLLDRNVQGENQLTVLNDLGVDVEVMNPTDWYQTMLEGRMMKVEHLTVRDWIRPGETRLDYYINRRIDNLYDDIVGTRVVKGSQHLALNGIYFYLDDILAYKTSYKDDVFNCRMRMDFSTIFPEVMSNNMRMNGDYTKEDDNIGSQADHTFKYGRNFYFPKGYLANVDIKGNGYLVYRRPRQHYFSMHGDEFICQGNFDIEFKLPPVPDESDYEIRLGYAPMGDRGICQIYFDGEPQGIPLDMTRDLTHASLLGTNFSKTDYRKMTDEEKIEDRKTLKNKGFYRGANGAFRTDGSKPYYFSEEAHTIRIILCTKHMKPGETHYLRLRAVSSKMGNNNEAMLDYLELVPKSVWGIGDGDAKEDDL